MPSAQAVSVWGALSPRNETSRHTHFSLGIDKPLFQRSGLRLRASLGTSFTPSAPCLSPKRTSLSAWPAFLRMPSRVSWFPSALLPSCPDSQTQTRTYSLLVLAGRGRVIIAGVLPPWKCIERLPPCFFDSSTAARNSPWGFIPFLT